MGKTTGKRVLVHWLSKKDWLSLAAQGGANRREQIYAHLDGVDRTSLTPSLSAPPTGTIEAILSQEPFEVIVLVGAHPQPWDIWWAEHLDRSRIEFVHVDPSDAQDHESVLQSADQVLARVSDQFASHQIGVHLNAVSPAIEGAWMLLGCTKYAVTYYGPQHDEYRVANLMNVVAEWKTNIASEAMIPLGDGFHLEDHLTDLRRRYLIEAMRQAGGVKAVAARLLGMKHYQTLSAQLTRLNII